MSSHKQSDDKRTSEPESVDEAELDSLLPHRAAIEQAVNDVLHEWGLNDAALQLVSVSENLVFKVTGARTGASEASVANYVLRVHRPGYHTLAELESEQLWTESLNQSGIAAPRAVRTNRGKFYVTTTTAHWHEPRQVGLSHWVEGRLLSETIDATEDADELRQHFHTLGALIGQLHNQAVQWQVPANFTRPALDADGLMGSAPFWGPFWQHPSLTSSQRSLSAQARAALHRHISVLQTRPDITSVIHADMHPGNLLVDGSTVRLLDFDDAAFGLHHYDLAVALLSYHNHQHFDELEDGLIAGYRSQRPWSDEDRAELPTFLLVRALAIIGWLADRPEFAAGQDELIAAAEVRTRLWLNAASERP